MIAKYKRTQDNIQQNMEQTQNPILAATPNNKSTTTNHSLRRTSASKQLGALMHFSEAESSSLMLLLQ